MVSIRDALTEGIRLLENSSPSPALDAELLLYYVSSMSRLELIVRRDEPLQKYDLYISLIQRRKNGEPIAYLTGEKEFMSLPFSVSPAVLIPRPDTETLAEWAISHIKDHKVLDIGTGSGCLAVSVKHYCPQAEVFALDVSDSALSLARKNAERNGADVNFFSCNILKDDLPDTYDFILSNPPYITKEEMDALDTDVKDFEPHLALFGGDDGLDFYRVIAKKAFASLNKNGYLAVEIGWLQEEAVTELFASHGFTQITTLFDLAENPRVILGKKE